MLPHVIQSEIKEITLEVPVSEVMTKKQQQYEVTLTNESKYVNMTLLIAKKGDLERIKAKLKENDVDCSIEIRFQKQKLKPVNNTAIIYHNSPFEQVRNVLVNAAQFNFYNGKPVILIAVEKNLKVD